MMSYVGRELRGERCPCWWEAGSLRLWVETSGGGRRLFINWGVWDRPIHHTLLKSWGRV